MHIAEERFQTEFILVILSISSSMYNILFYLNRHNPSKPHAAFLNTRFDRFGFIGFLSLLRSSNATIAHELKNETAEVECKPITRN